jgi:hypothetical protein
MVFSRLSIDLFSLAMAWSTLWGVAEPVVTPSPVFNLPPDDCAVPAPLVPGGGASCEDVVRPDEGPPVPCPVLWAKAAGDASRIAIVASAAVADSLRMEILPCGRQRFRKAAVPAALEQCDLRKLIEFDDDTFDKLKQLGRDRMATLQELADEAFADLLRKHGIPIDLKDALRKSAKLQDIPKQNPATPKRAGKRGRKT